jgi:phage RecT family recombinase
MNELVALEKQLEPLAPHFAQVLGNTMPVERLVRTVVISAQRLPQLLDCDRQSLFNGAMTFAVLGLEVDGATGQGYLVPFNDRKRSLKIVQPIIGYKGYNTLGARSGLTIAGGVVREGDEFDYDEGSKAFVHHKRKLGGEKERKIVAAWSTATSTLRPAIVKVLSIDELLSIKGKSPRGTEPPWADREIGFPAMCEKSAKRRLARDMPLNVFQLAARMEEAFEEQGKPAWISDHRSVVIEGEIIAPRHDSRTPDAQELVAPAHEIWNDRLAEAAAKGTAALSLVWQDVPREHKLALKNNLETEHKPAAAKVDGKMLGTDPEPHGAEPEPAPTHTPRSAAGETRGGSNQQQPPAAAGISQDKIALARQRGRDDRAKGVKRSATPLEYRAPDRTSEALGWIEGWNEVKS